MAKNTKTVELSEDEQKVLERALTARAKQKAYRQRPDVQERARERGREQRAREKAVLEKARQLGMLGDDE